MSKVRDVRRMFRRTTWLHVLALAVLGTIIAGFSACGIGGRTVTTTVPSSTCTSATTIGVISIPQRVPYPGLYPILTIGGAGYVDKKGKVVIPPQYEQGLYFSDNRAAVMVGGRWGSIDPAGNMVIPPTYENPLYFREGRALYRDRKGLFGYKDVNGKTVVEPQYFEAKSFSEGVAAVKTLDGWFLINRQGERVSRGYFEDVDSYGEGLVAVRPTGEKRWGYADYSGNIVIPADFDWAWGFSSGRARVRLGEVDSFIDRNGATIFSVSPDATALHFSEDRVQVRYGEKQSTSTKGYHNEGYLDLQGKKISEALFDTAYDYSEGLAAVQVGDRWGYIDKSGEFTIKPRFYYAEPYFEGYATVWFEGETAIIDTTGGIIWRGPLE